MISSTSKLLLLFAFFVSCQSTISEPLYRRSPSKLVNDDLYYVETEYDWNGDGISDNFRLRVQKEVEPLVEGLNRRRQKLSIGRIIAGLSSSPVSTIRPSGKTSGPSESLM